MEERVRGEGGIVQKKKIRYFLFDCFINSLLAVLSSHSA